MAYQKTEFSFPSTSGLANIHAVKYIPVGVEVVAVLQIAHGMAEHLERYEGFIEALSKEGIAVYINDHLGHGRSVSSENEKGYFGELGYKNLVADCVKLTELAKEDYPSIPYIVFGHSMGSFIMRAYCAEHSGNIDGAIFCGTGGANPAAGIGIAITKMIQRSKGDHYRSNFINNLAFGAYNKRFEGRTPFDWLTKDNDQVDKYIADPECGYLFTTNGYIGLFSALKNTNSKDWYKAVPASLPIYLIAGEDDPVGNYGIGVSDVYNRLLDTGHTDVDISLYPNARHEILNESDTFDKVVTDVLAFIKRVSA